MKRTTVILSAALMSTGVMAITPSVMAQPAAAQAATAVSDQQLKSFVDASVKVNELSQQYMPKLQQVGENTDKQKAVVDEANGKMMGAVKQSGLQVEEFKRISQAVQQDPQLMKRAQTMLPHS